MLDNPPVGPSSTSPAPRLAAAPNFRDIGGRIGQEGRAVRHGLLYRSDSLAFLSADDFTILQGLNVGLVCDLRSANERSHRPTGWPDHYRPTVLDMDINADLRAANDRMLDILRADPTPNGATAMMMESYRVIPLALQGYLADLFIRLARVDAPALLFHCTAGKDRTGVMSAILLLALGVSEDDVLEDYMQTERYVDFARTTASVAEVTARMLGRPAPDGVPEAMARVRPEYLRNTIASITDKFGSLSGYLAAAGVTEAQLTAVRDRLLHRP